MADNNERKQVPFLERPMNRLSRGEAVFSDDFVDAMAEGRKHPEIDLDKVIVPAPKSFSLKIQDSDNQTNCAVAGLPEEDEELAVPKECADDDAIVVNEFVHKTCARHGSAFDRMLKKYQ